MQKQESTGDLEWFESWEPTKCDEILGGVGGGYIFDNEGNQWNMRQNDDRRG